MRNRPCFLVIDQEFAGSISTRKLVIETAKFNVITAYSNHEALELLQRFPAMDGAVVDLAVRDLPCEELVRGLKSMRPEMPVIAISAPGLSECSEADFNLQSFAPEPLLELLKKLQQQKAEQIEQHEEMLAREQQ